MRIVLYGVSSPYASEAVETLERLGWELAAAVRNVDAPVPAEVGAVVDADDLDTAVLELPFLVAMVTPAERRAATADARRRGFTREATLVDPTAVVASSARLGAGSYVNAGAIVAAGVVAGSSVALNRGASVGHHSVLGDDVSIGPGAVTGGSCRIEDGAFLGVGAVLAPEVVVGAEAVVGAGAVVIRDVAPGEVVAGNPARVLRTVAGQGDVAVP